MLDDVSTEKPGDCTPLRGLRRPLRNLVYKCQYKVIRQRMEFPLLIRNNDTQVTDETKVRSTTARPISRSQLDVMYPPSNLIQPNCPHYFLSTAYCPTCRLTHFRLPAITSTYTVNGGNGRFRLGRGAILARTGNAALYVDGRRYVEGGHVEERY